MIPLRTSDHLAIGQLDLATVSSTLARISAARSITSAVDSLAGGLVARCRRDLTRAVRPPVRGHLGQIPPMQKPKGATTTLYRTRSIPQVMAAEQELKKEAARQRAGARRV